MEEIEDVLTLFDSAETWNAFIELSEMRTGLVNELSSRLMVELQKIAKENLANTGWTFYVNGDENYPKRVCRLYPYPDEELIGVAIEWGFWTIPWCRRGACVFVNADKTNYMKVRDRIKASRDVLPLHGYEETTHGWLPFAKQIPARVFQVEPDVTSVEKCLYLAKDHAPVLARSLWEEVFQPFAYPEYAEKMRNCVVI